MTTTAVDLGPVSAHARAKLAALLDKRRVVVWYDPDRAFGGLVEQLTFPDCVVVSAAVSALRARREAETVYRRIGEGIGPDASVSLLIYVPRRRGATPEAQQVDPFEVFVRVGAAFGESSAERLDAMARIALPDRAAEIERLFREAQPTLEMLDGLRTAQGAPLVRQALGTESPAEAAVHILTRKDAGDRLAKVPGAATELQRILGVEIGLPNGSMNWPAFRDRLALYLLTSELHFDLPGGLPAALTGVAHADDRYRDRILAICDRWRETEDGREAYVARASDAEVALRLPAVLGTHPSLGSRDTFRAQERARLGAIGALVQAGELSAARSLLSTAVRAPWRRDPERQVLWRAAERCVEFLEAAEQIVATGADQARGKGMVRGLIERYVAVDGLWQVDRAQRLFEQAGAQCAQEDEVDPLLQVCRKRYRAIVEPVQEAFQAAAKAEGWPPEGIRRQTETFDATVSPELEARRKTAYFLVDALRYEMGRDLAEALNDLGRTTVEAAANVLPTTTPCGMAALMPGAHGAYEYILDGGDVVPSVSGVRMSNVAERTGLLKKRFGDRFIDLRLESILTTAPRRLRQQVGTADFVVVRTQDIDALGEGPSLYRARKVMSDVLGELRTAAQRLIGLGFQTLVFAADHGHMLVPEVLPGDVLPTPPGEWKVKKRRSMLGQSHADTPGVLVLRAAQVGIVGPPELGDLAAAAGFRTFVDGAGYFHEGLSLQECVIPIVTLRSSSTTATGPLPAMAGADQVRITYRAARFTSSVVGLKLSLTASPMFAESAAIRLEAFDAKDTKKVVGHAADCDAYDPKTGEVTVPADQEVGVPLVIDTDFTGSSIEVRATDPRTGAILGRLTLKNGRLE